MKSFWRHLTNFWTLIFFIAIVYDYVLGNALDRNNTILLISVFYTTALAIYSAEKEFKRWHDSHKTRHPGETYVIIWTLLVFGLLAIKLYFHSAYELPPEVRASYIVVIGVLALTKESKYLYLAKKKSSR